MDLSVVIPVYNSSESLGPLVERLKPVLDNLAERYELIFVNDGSRDGSWQQVRTLNGNVDQENVWHQETVDLGDYQSSDFKIRFRAKVSGSREDGNVDYVQIVASGPDTETQPIQRIFFTAVTSAQRSVYLTTPYFVPDQSMLVALETAALRGVQVKLLLPHKTDMRLALHAGRSYYDQLLRNGVEIYEYHVQVEDHLVTPGHWWFAVQAASHPLPCKWGRLPSEFVQACDSVFKCDYFSYPDWIPAVDVLGVPYDASQAFHNVYNPIPVEETSWGAIKTLYR